MELVFFAICLIVIFYTWRKSRRQPSQAFGTVDAIVPAFNEQLCIEQSLRNLLRNPYINRVICVDDGSTDGTAQVLRRLSQEGDERLIVVFQANTGKGGALMNGLRHAVAEQVYLTDADTYLPPDQPGLGYMLAEIEDGADAVGGIPASNLSGAGLLAYIRASVKVPMITIQRTFQQIAGGAPFIISGACGMFKTEVLRKHGFSDRTKVEDLDLSWTLVSEGYRVRQANRCVVYSQECNSLREEWKRWRRWIVGYAVCMRLHRHLLISRFGLFTIFSMVVPVTTGVLSYAFLWPAAIEQFGFPQGLLYAIFPVLWVLVVSILGAISAAHHRDYWLIPLASLAVFFVLFAYAVWLVHGLKAFVTGREPERDKPTRYAYVVD